MKHVDNTHYHTHGEAWLLLPWYANGSLDGTDKQLVEDHLKVCLPCRGELKNQRMLFEKVGETTAFQIAGQASFSKLQNRIHIEESGELSLHQSVSARLGDFSRGMIGRFMEKYSQHRTAFAFSALLLVLIPVLVPVYSQIDRLWEPEFRTLSSSKNPSASENEIRIVFSGGLMRKQMDDILAPVKGRIVDGPSANGVFRIRIENPRKSPVDIVAVISELRDNAGVVFAEPLSPQSPLVDRGMGK